MTDPDNVRFANQFRKHRPHSLRSLHGEGLNATKNLAERLLRLAVIIGKTSGCNRAERSVESHAILASVLVTCRQQKRSIMDCLVELPRSLDTLPPLLTKLNTIPPWTLPSWTLNKYVAPLVGRRSRCPPASRC